MKSHKIYCGLNSPNLTEDQALDCVTTLALTHFPHGHTLYEAKGKWRGLVGDYTERTIIVEVWEVNGCGTPPVAELAADYKELAKQESVVVISQPVEGLVI